MRFTIKPYFLILGLFNFMYQPAFAEEFHPIVSIGYDFGGDTLLDYTIVKVNDRDVNRKGKITAGNGLTLAIGAYMPILEDVGVQATVGYKIDSRTFVSAYTSFERIPIDLMAVAHLGQHHSLSGGITYHLNPRFTLESSTVNGVDTFDNALGAIAEYTYTVQDSRDGGLKLGIRYTNIRYQLTGSNQSFDGSSVGLILYAY